ncbi:ATP11 protein-domain-containing protein [Lasiosphaeria miniovina]|uniref:ATP11 protein-domain-containing protein n=1 Tax=Lasiosphaeria miniovina TaxID=1954250 RepID=A0AA40BGZ0_9PEZI|nr:ATP11 protein-domain-containing protein [Lasiosphaeria miniovina]KAK0734055.1 ATP11 protein-domain-containing protein [Lasiosphaeria miniovina]
MATASRVPVLRHLTTTSCCQLRALRASNQRRWAQVSDVRFLTTTQPPERIVLEKYREKLDRKAREEGLPDIDALKKAYADKIEALRKQAAAATAPVGLDGPSSILHPPPQPPLPQSSTPSSSSSSSPSSSSSSHSKSGSTSFRPSTNSGSGVKPLDGILDLPKVRTLPIPELTAIWRQRHAGQANSLCAVIPAGTYAAMEATARQFPQFVVPVPHPGQGAEMHFLQWTWDASVPGTPGTVLFTQLAEYKARGEFAAPHATVTHYADLAADKGVVLMQGHVAEDRGVSVENAQWLVLCLQRFYGGWDPAAVSNGDEDAVALARERAAERRNLLEWFSKGDSRFSVEKLLEEAERVG